MLLLLAVVLQHLDLPRYCLLPFGASMDLQEQERDLTAVKNSRTRSSLPSTVGTAMTFAVFPHSIDTLVVVTHHGRLHCLILRSSFTPCES